MIAPPALINTPPPDFTRRWYDSKLILSTSPSGMVRTDPASTMTFAGAVTVEDIEQLEGMVQSPEDGGLHDIDWSAESTSMRANVPRLLVMDFPVVCSAERIVESGAKGSFSRSMAKAPETAGVAKEVPLPVDIPPPGTDDVTDSPGAKSERKEALSVNDETWSESLVDPTLIAPDTHAGASMAVELPSFPDATTGAIPADNMVPNSDSYSELSVSHVL